VVSSFVLGLNLRPRCDQPRSGSEDISASPGMTAAVGGRARRVTAVPVVWVLADAVDAVPLGITGPSRGR